MIVVAAIVVAAIVVGCGDSNGSSTMETLTEEQAYQRVEQYIQAAVDQITPRPRLVDREVPGPMECDTGTDTYLTERAYRLSGIPAGNNTEIFDTLHDYWADNGYRITEDLRDRAEARTLKARHNDDDFSVGLQESIQGGLTLFSSSPCIPLSDFTVSPRSADPREG